MAAITLSQRDKDDLLRLVATEVDHTLARRNPTEYQRQVAGVVDTVLNRMASPQFPNTVREVANQNRQFSAISGPSGTRKYDFDVRNVPDSAIPSALRGVFDQHIGYREQGNPSTVGGGLHYANPNFSSRNNMAWINALDGPTFGAGQSIHKHGTTAGFRPVEATLGQMVAPTPATRQTASQAVNQLAGNQSQFPSLAYASQAPNIPAPRAAPPIPATRTQQPPSTLSAALEGRGYTPQPSFTNDQLFTRETMPTLPPVPQASRNQMRAEADFLPRPSTPADLAAITPTGAPVPPPMDIGVPALPVNSSVPMNQPIDLLGPQPQPQLPPVQGQLAPFNPLAQFGLSIPQLPTIPSPQEIDQGMRSFFYGGERPEIGRKSANAINRNGVTPTTISQTFRNDSPLQRRGAGDLDVMRANRAAIGGPINKASIQDALRRGVTLYGV